MIKGFTLIELLIVIGITLVLAGAVSPIYGNLQVSAQLNEESSQIVQAIRLAKEKSSARVNNSQYGVYFQANSYTLYQGSAYALRNSSYDRVTTLSDSVTITSTLTGNEINFSKGLGEPSNTGTVTITHSVSGSRVIDINSLGKVEEN